MRAQNDGLWALTALTAPNAAWLRDEGLHGARYATRAEALRTVAAVSCATLTLPGHDGCADRLLPLSCAERGWVITAKPPVRANVTSEMFDERKVAAALLRVSGLGSRRFRTRMAALQAYDALRRDRQMIDRVLAVKPSLRPVLAAEPPSAPQLAA